MQYKVVNIGGGNLTNKYVDEDKINAVANEGWKLMSIQQPPSSMNNRWVIGVFVKDDAVKFAANTGGYAKNSPTPLDGGKK